MKSFIVFLSFFTLQFSISATASNLCSGSVSVKDWRPWPWGNETQFQWKNLQGVWQTTSHGCGDYFFFNVVNDSSSDELLVNITQVDPAKCVIIGKGVGYLDDRFIYAQMTGRSGAYNLTVHAFNSSDVSSSVNLNRTSPLHSVVANGKVVLALAIFPVGKWGQRSSFEIGKLSADGQGVCQ